MRYSLDEGMAFGIGTRVFAGRVLFYFSGYNQLGEVLCNNNTDPLIYIFDWHEQTHVPHTYFRLLYSNPFSISIYLSHPDF